MRLLRMALLLALASLGRATLAASEPAAAHWAHWLSGQQQTTLLPAWPNPRTPGAPWIKVGVRSQTLSVFDEAGVLIQRYPVSTARRGVGEVQNSYQTPRGWHRICEKIGDQAAADTF